MDHEKIPLLGSIQTKINLSRRNQIIAVTGVTLSMLSNGCAGGFSAVALPSFIGDDAEIHATHEELSWIACMSTMGCILGNFIGGVISDCIGRRKSILFTTFVSLAGWISIGTAINLEQIFIGRALTGLATGLYSAPIQVYICEIVDPSIRGVAGAAPSLTVAIGILVVYTLGSVLYWRTLALACSACPIIVFLYVYFLPESPVWLDTKGRQQDALKSLQWLHRDPNSNDQDYFNTLKCLKENKSKKVKVPWRTQLNRRFLRPSVLKSLFAGFLLFFFQQFSGIFPILSYTTLIFRFSGKLMNEYLETVCVGLIRLVSTILAIFLIKFLNRKTLLLISGFFMFLANGILGTYFYLKESQDPHGNLTKINIEDYAVQTETGEWVNFEWIPLACLLVFMGAFSCGFGIVPWFLVPDLMPADVRSLACSLVFTFGQICRVIAVKTFLDFIDFMGADGTFWTFSAISFMSMIFVTFFVPNSNDEDEDEH